MRRFINLIAFTLLVWMTNGCKNAGGSAPASDSITTAARDSNTGVKNDTNAIARDNSAATATPDTADLSFIKKAASGGLLEVTLGNFAGSRGKSVDVKHFGEMMIKDHTEANSKLKAIAGQLQVGVTDSLMPAHAHHRNALGAMRGTAFDKAYMDMMINDHKEDIADFEKASKSNNALVRNFAAQTLPVLNKHLDSANAIVSRMH